MNGYSTFLHNAYRIQQSNGIRQCEFTEQLRNRMCERHKVDACDCIYLLARQQTVMTQYTNKPFNSPSKHLYIRVYKKISVHILSPSQTICAFSVRWQPSCVSTISLKECMVYTSFIVLPVFESTNLFSLRNRPAVISMS